MNDGKQTPLKQKHTEGIGLIEAVIAVGIIGFIVVASSTLNAKMTRQAKYFETQGSLEDAKNYIRASLDCGSTVSDVWNQCTGKSYADDEWVRLRDADDKVIVSEFPNTTTLGDHWRFRAKCAEKTLGIFFQVERIYTVKGQVGKNPVTQKTSTWKTAFESVPLGCPPRTGWFDAPREVCPAFCNSLGLTNVFSPDSYTVTWKGLTYNAGGGKCSSGEYIPPSAVTAYNNGFITYDEGCWWGPCPNGSNVKNATSNGQRCYGDYWDNSSQKKDNDVTDYTQACYCE